MNLSKVEVFVRSNTTHVQQAQVLRWLVTFLKIFLDFYFAESILPFLFSSRYNNNIKQMTNHKRTTYDYFLDITSYHGNA